MPFAPHVRVSFGGTLTGETGYPDEIWNCSVNGEVGPAWDADEYLGVIQAALLAWFRSNDSKCSSQSTLGYVKANKIGADGKYVDQGTTHVHSYASAMTGGAGPVNPDILTTAISWGTGKARGPGSHGRIYLPNNTLGTGIGMTVSIVEQDALVAAGVNLLQILNAGGGGNGIPGHPNTNPVLQPVIASRVNATNTPILSCRVGNVKDVQRRRKDAYRESYRIGVFLAVAD